MTSLFGKIYLRICGGILTWQITDKADLHRIKIAADLTPGNNSPLRTGLYMNTNVFCQSYNNFSYFPYLVFYLRPFHWIKVGDARLEKNMFCIFVHKFWICNFKYKCDENSVFFSCLLMLTGHCQSNLVLFCF